MNLLFASVGSISPSNNYSGFISFRITQMHIFQSSHFFAFYTHVLKETENDDANSTKQQKSGPSFQDRTIFFVVVHI